MRTLLMGIVMGSGLALAACAGPAPQPEATPAAEAPAAAPAAPPYQPAISLNEIMVNVVDSNSHKLWDAEQKPPTKDAEWAELEHAAVTLAAAGNLTAVSGNGEKDQQWVAQADWKKHSEAVSAAGRAAAVAVRGKDVAGLRKAGDDLVMTCINCHREYKLEVPKIWSDHEQAH